MWNGKPCEATKKSDSRVWGYRKSRATTEAIAGRPQQHQQCQQTNGRAKSNVRLRAPRASSDERLRSRGGRKGLNAEQAPAAPVSVGRSRASFCSSALSPAKGDRHPFASPDHTALCVRRQSLLSGDGIRDGSFTRMDERKCRLSHAKTRRLPCEHSNAVAEEASTKRCHDAKRSTFQRPNPSEAARNSQTAEGAEGRKGLMPECATTGRRYRSKTVR